MKCRPIFFFFYLIVNYTDAIFFLFLIFEAETDLGFQDGC